MTVTETLTTAASAPSAARTKRKRPRGALTLAILVPVGLLVWWWLAAPYASPAELPTPQAVLERTVDLLIGPDSFNTWTSLARIFAAVLFALVIGAFLVFLTRVLPISETLVGAMLLPFLNSVPALGWAILGVIWFGVGNFAVIFVVTLILIPFCMVNLWEGLRSLDPGLQEMGKSFTRSNAKILWRIQGPMLTPYVLAAVRLSFSVGWKVALIAEFFGAQAGLGLIMNRARQSFDTPTVFATIIVVLIIVIITERLVFDPLATMFARRSGTGAAR